MPCLELITTENSEFVEPMTFAQAQEKFLSTIKNNPKATLAAVASLAAIIYHRKKITKIIKKDPVGMAFLLLGGSIVLYKTIFN